LELILDKKSWWKAAISIALMPVILPVAAIANLFSSRTRRSPEYVVKHLSDFIDGSSGPYDWDEFTSVRIADPVLEDIRMRAASIDPRTTHEAESILRGLLAEAQTLQRERP
jgi:hypothetical protein